MGWAQVRAFLCTVRQRRRAGLYLEDGCCRAPETAAAGGLESSSTLSNCAPSHCRLRAQCFPEFGQRCIEPLSLSLV